MKILFRSLLTPSQKKEVFCLSLIKLLLLLIIFFPARLLAQKIASVSTAIPAFIGYTEKALDNAGNTLNGSPKRINNITEYRNYFGNEDSPYYKKILLDDNNNITQIVTTPYLIYPSIVQYFKNGGGACYIISIGNYSSPVGKSDFLKGLDSAGKYDEPTMLLFPDAVNLPGNDLYDIQKTALQQAGSRGDRFCILDLKLASSKASFAANIREFREHIGNEYLDFGAIYSPFLAAIPARPVDYREWKDALFKQDNKVQLADLCNDPATRKKITDLDTLIMHQDARAGDLAYDLNIFFPLAGSISGKLDQSPVFIPPSGPIAGIYCRSDATRGVWVSPNGKEYNVKDIYKSAYIINKTEESNLTGNGEGKYINAIRYFNEYGFMPWGGRTLTNNSDWKYIATRRMAIFVDASIKRSLQQFSIPDNSDNTCLEIKKEIEIFLENLWRSGALRGMKSEHAYYVAAGLNQTMTPRDIAAGKLIIEMGMAMQRPAEFIVRRYEINVPINH